MGKPWILVCAIGLFVGLPLHCRQIAGQPSQVFHVIQDKGVPADLSGKFGDIFCLDQNLSQNGGSPVLYFASEKGIHQLEKDTGDVSLIYAGKGIGSIFVAKEDIYFEQGEYGQIRRINTEGEDLAAIFEYPFNKDIYPNESYSEEACRYFQDPDYVLSGFYVCGKQIFFQFNYCGNSHISEFVAYDMDTCQLWALAYDSRVFTFSANYFYYVPRSQRTYSVQEISGMEGSERTLSGDGRSTYETSLYIPGDNTLEILPGKIDRIDLIAAGGPMLYYTKSPSTVSVFDRDNMQERVIFDFNPYYDIQDMAVYECRLYLWVDTLLQGIRLYCYDPADSSLRFMDYTEDIPQHWAIIQGVLYTQEFPPMDIEGRMKNSGEGEMLYLVETGSQYAYIDQFGRLVIRPFDGSPMLWQDLPVFSEKNPGFGLQTGAYNSNGQQIPLWEWIQFYYTPKWDGVENQYMKVNKAGEMQEGDVITLTEAPVVDGYVLAGWERGWNARLYPYSIVNGVYFFHLPEAVGPGLSYQRMKQNSFLDGLALFQEGFLYGFTDTLGNRAVAAVYEKAWPFQEELAVVMQNGKYGAVDRNGEIIIPLVYEELLSFSNGLAAFKQNGRYGFINKENQRVIEAQYDRAGFFLGNLCLVELDGHTYYINKENKIVYRFESNIWERAFELQAHFHHQDRTTRLYNESGGV